MGAGIRWNAFLALRWVLSALIVLLPLAAAAQNPERIYRIGFFSPAASDPALEAVLFDAFRKLGYAEGKNLIVERRYAYNRLDQLPILAAELVKLEVDVVLATGTVAPLAIRKASATIPVVIWSAGDPVHTGIAASLARPGGNITGLTIDSPELAGKRLQLLKEMLPALARVAVIWDAANPYSAIVLGETQEAARALGIRIQSIEVRSPGDFDGAFGKVVSENAGALIVVEDPLTFTQIDRIVSFEASRRLPVMYGMKEFVSAGGLIAYGPSYPDLLRRAADYVDRILRGAKPADLPIEQPTKFELAINARAAKAIGIPIPQSLLLRADDVIQ